MASIDLHTRVSQSLALNTTAIGADGMINGNSIDMNSGNGFESLEFLLAVGLYTDGDYSITLQDSPDDTVWTAVAAEYVLGASELLSADNSTSRLGYVGKQQYARCVLNAVSVTTGATATVMALRGSARHKPVA